MGDGMRQMTRERIQGRTAEGEMTRRGAGASQTHKKSLWTSSRNTNTCMDQDKDIHKVRQTDSKTNTHT